MYSWLRGIYKKYDEETCEKILAEYKKVAYSMDKRGSFDIEQIWNIREFFFTCERCGDQFPIWWTPRRAWLSSCKKAGWEVESEICKDCYEDYIKKPIYFGAEEYIITRPLLEVDSECNFIEDMPRWSALPYLRALFNLKKRKVCPNAIDIAEKWREEKIAEWEKNKSSC